MKGKANRGSTIAFGEFGLKALYPGWITSRQIEAAHNVGATYVEIHTGRYSDAVNEEEIEQEYELIAESASEAYGAGLRVNAGHGLNYINTTRVASLEAIEELSIGHAIMTRAIFVGLDQAVREMLALMM